MKNQTIIAFDFGTKSIGAAIGQTVTGTASALKAFKAKDGIPNWDELAVLLNEWQPDTIVVGLPTDMQGLALKDITSRAQKFANRLHGRFGYPVVLHDERLSTQEAKAMLFERGGFKALTKGRVDCESAVVILESWFESLYQSEHSKN